MSDRSSRESKSRENTTRIEEWVPASNLMAPDPPSGYQHRWIRESVNGYDDKNNVFKKRSEGWELVQAAEYPDWDGPVVSEGKNAGTIGNGGLLLARIPLERARARDAHFGRITKNAMDAVNRNWMNENSSQVQTASKRKSSVSFSSRRGEIEG